MPREIESLYAWTRQTRESIFNFVEQMPPDALTAEHPHIPMGSFRNLLVHVASAYFFWVKRVGMGEKVAWPEPADFPDMTSVRALYNEVDALVADFLDRHPGDALHEPVTREVKRREGLVRFSLSPLWLVSNCITHEFNHKGQLLTSARARGHKFPGRSDLATPPGGYKLLERASDDG